ncbi:MAG TPA: hypothetical protein PLH49_00405, partial [Chitinophagaceae bacterium]|nr:hypothetical protein [Chitinophagaceae bacterium]
MSKTVDAQQPVFVFADTVHNDTLRNLSELLVDQLSKSTRVEFKLQSLSQFTGKGIVLASVFQKTPRSKPSTLLRQSGIEAYSVTATTSSVIILGNSNMAVQHGIFAYLDKLGYRYYFANPDWYIVPNTPELFFNWSVNSKPAFEHRRIWYGYGTGSKIADADYNF